ncbi:protoheme IX farnesyltransferase [Sulfurovum sp. zt1-1]|uniref:Protoheme IX farnesyltransferase n=1 Tax=Sulfurovum zhangzhouensis TaxID=3019067 RepID=A0ABT7QYJ4_9BACT|nr:protoheme IX farnesyltransferase [Sulfurovum zhangzhouensis]MDM5271908.1 protoheme IX farnesyltransferase [Sulfurovum zhangzhouensis]
MISLLMDLTKFRLSAAVTLSTVFGFILAEGNDIICLGYSTLAVFLLALGVSALNQYQEYEHDRQMARTKYRPIPSGRISPRSALLLSIILIVASLVLIYFQLGYSGLLLFLFVPLWYNGVYTFLKRYSAFAVVPGGLLGVIPPAIGWLAAGRSLAEPKFLALGLLFFVWQVPHFWLLAAKYADDYRTAGFPSAVETFGIEGFRRVLFVWWTLTVFCALFLTIIFGVKNLVLIVLFITLALAAIVVGTRILLDTLTPARAGGLFKVINLFLLLTLILLSVASL